MLCLLSLVASLLEHQLADMSALRASIGTLAVLGLRDLRMAERPTTAYLMVGGRCASDCSYCGQGRSACGDGRHLSRIVWPDVSQDELIEAFSAHPGSFSRVCFQTTTSRGVVRDLVSLVPRIRAALDVPVSVSYRVRGLEEARRLFAAGVERIGVAIDVCSARLYPQLRGGTLEEAVAQVKELARHFPGRISTHIIIGLGESEQEAAELIMELHEAGILVSLFAFTPVRGTGMEASSPPEMLSYRKMQALVGLLDAGERPLELTYDAENRLCGFGVTADELRRILDEQPVFLTHGCPGCNRPFYNERPGMEPFNFPTMHPVGNRRVVAEFVVGLEAQGFVFGHGQKDSGSRCPCGEP